ncbi:MAG: ATP-binding protein [Mycobacteriales bacterium]
MSPDPDAPEDEVLVLGEVAVRHAGRLVEPSSPQTGMLLGALALAGPAGSTGSALGRALWPDDEADRHRSSLPVAVHRARGWLRGIAGDAVRVDSTATGYVLVGDTDADRFGRLVAAAGGLSPAARAEVLAGALALWRGEPLAGSRLGPAQEAAAEGLRRARRAATLWYGETLLELGRPADAAGALAPLAARHPLDETVQGALIEALAASGRQAEALDRYERLRLRLADELGIDPGRELSDTLVRVLRRDVPGPDATEPSWRPEAPPAQLPPPVADFAGRADALAALDRLHAAAAAGRVAVCALDGIGGVGKTALAVRWAHRVAGGYPDGQLYADLRGYAAGDPVPPAEALGRFLRALGVPADQVPAGTEEAAALYRSLLAGRRMLVLLDNARSADQVRPLLPGAPGCLVVVTSRDRLDGLVAVDGAARMTLDVLDLVESVALLAAVLGPDRVDAEPAAAAELAGRCGRLPLALRIVAAHLAAEPARSLADQAAALRADRWAELAVPGDPAASVRAAFDSSYHRLEPAARRLFRLLGQAPGGDGAGIPPPAAAALAGTSTPDTRATLRRLAAAHLVEGRGDRYVLHDLTADYARGRAEPDDAAALARLCRWYLDTAEAAAELVAGPPLAELRLPWPAEPGTAAGPAPLAFAGPDEAAAWLEAELPTLAAVARHAAARGAQLPGGAQVGWLLPDALSRYVFMRNALAEWQALGEAALAAATAAGDVRATAAAHRMLANQARVRGAVPVAVDHYERSRAAAVEAGWAAGELSALNGLAATYGASGDVLRAAELFGEVVAHSEARGLVASEQRALGNLAVALGTLGRLEEAVDCHTRLGALARQAGDREGEASVLSGLAEVYVDMGRLDEAERLAAGAYEEMRRSGYRSMEGDALVVLAKVHAERGEPEKATELAEAARQVAVELGHHWIEEQAESVLAAAAVRLGAYQDAGEHLRRLLDLSLASGNTFAEAEARITRARVAAALGRPEAALAEARRALALAHQRGYRVLEADALLALAALHRDRGEPAAAATHAGRALALARESRAGLREAAARRLLDGPATPSS